MRIAVPREADDEQRVALIPDSVARLVRSGHAVTVEAGAGSRAGFSDEAYTTAGATIAGRGALASAADVLVSVGSPPEDLATGLPRGAIVAGLLEPAAGAPHLERLAQHGLTAYAMELVPRTTKAQSMDVLSSQATVAGYKAVLIGASALPRLLPMLTTAAGTLTPARCFVVGAGVAGLQAIATARRLGAVVSAFDVRPVVKEQVQSLGASFLDVEQVAAEGEGGYARELAADQQQRVADAIGEHLVTQDLVITTAQIPGRPAPRIITTAMVDRMRPGSVIVDLAAESGGNCEVTRAGEVVRHNGVAVHGPAGIAASVPTHASQMYSRNIQTFLEHITSVSGDPLADPILGPMCVVHDGAVRAGR